MKEIIDDGSGALRVGQLDAKYNALKNKITASVEASASSSSYTKVLESEHGKPVQATADPEEVDDDDDAKSHASVEHEEDDDDVLASILGGPSAAKKPKAATPASKGGTAVSADSCCTAAATAVPAESGAANNSSEEGGKIPRAEVGHPAGHFECHKRLLTSRSVIQHFCHEVS